MENPKTSPKQSPYIILGQHDADMLKRMENIEKRQDNLEAIYNRILNIAQEPPLETRQTIPQRPILFDPMDGHYLGSPVLPQSQLPKQQSCQPELQQAFAPWDMPPEGDSKPENKVKPKKRSKWLTIGIFLIIFVILVVLFMLQQQGYSCAFLPKK